MDLVDQRKKDLCSKDNSINHKPSKCDSYPTGWKIRNGKPSDVYKEVIWTINGGPCGTINRGPCGTINRGPCGTMGGSGQSWAKNGRSMWNCGR